jgi:phage-related tail protein
MKRRVLILLLVILLITTAFVTANIASTSAGKAYDRAREIATNTGKKLCDSAKDAANCIKETGSKAYETTMKEKLGLKKEENTVDYSKQSPADHHFGPPKDPVDATKLHN